MAAGSHDPWGWLCDNFALHRGHVWFRVSMGATRCHDHRLYHALRTGPPDFIDGRATVCRHENPPVTHPGLDLGPGRTWFQHHLGFLPLPPVRRYAGRSNQRIVRFRTAGERPGTKSRAISVWPRCYGLGIVRYHGLALWQGFESCPVFRKWHQMAECPHYHQLCLGCYQRVTEQSGGLGHDIVGVCPALTA